jgi:ketosteroid isomerase-like protein
MNLLLALAESPSNAILNQQALPQMKTDAADIALRFIDCINLHSPAQLAALVTEDHLYIDAQGNQHRGRKQLERSWRACFEWFPDYSIRVDQAFANGNIAVVTGCATGTYSICGRMSSENRWKTPSAWQGVMRSGKIVEWRVYADNEPVWKAMGGRRYLSGSVFRLPDQSPSAPPSSDEKSKQELS